MIIETDNNVIYLSGALRTNQWPAIQTTAYLVFESYPLGVTLDFAGIWCVSVQGERTFVDALHTIESNNLPFVLTRVPPEIARRLQQKTTGHLYPRSVEPADETRIHQAISSETWWQRLWGAA